MKKLLFLILLFFSFCVFALDVKLNSTLAPGVTNVVASSTNTTTGTALTFDNDQVPKYGRFWMTANGVAATTNGTLKAYIITSPDGTTYDTGSLSPIYLSMSTIGTSTNTVSDWFPLYGVKSLKIGRIENTHLGAVSNITFQYEIIISR